MSRYRAVGCTDHDRGEPGKRRRHWHIERDGDRMGLRFESREEAVQEATRLSLAEAIPSDLKWPTGKEKR